MIPTFYMHILEENIIVRDFLEQGFFILLYFIATLGIIQPKQ